MIKLIAFCGNKCHGKTTAAKYVSGKFGHERISFASELKNISAALFGLNHEQLYGSEKETPDPNNFGLTPRTILQRLGTDVFRDSFSSHFPEHGSPWIFSTRRHIENNPCKCFVIDDCRFQDELEMVKSMGGVVIRISSSIRKPDSQTDSHASEQTDGLECDFTITNNHTLDDLYAKLDMLCRTRVL